MSDFFDFVLRSFPARIADLEFRMAVPRDWQIPKLPSEEVDFSTPAMFPLMIAVAPYAAIALTVAARPGYDDGSVSDWAQYLVTSNGIEPAAMGARAVGPFDGFAGSGRMEQDGAAMESRFAFFEDGGRLVQVGLIAPAALAGSVEEVWQRALDSFELEEPRGQRTPVYAAAVPNPEKPVPEPGFAQYALAADAASLDPEHEINANLRRRGAGLTPNVASVDEPARSATVAAGAIEALVTVPFGWHVMDDGRRTLVFEPSGNIQINLNRVRREGREPGEILDEIQDEALESYPEPQFLRLAEGGIHGLAIRNIQADGEALEQVHLLSPGPDGASMLRARVTARPDSITLATNLAELILKSVVFPAPEAAESAEPAPGDPSQPEWWRRALALERENRLEEAEETIRKGVQHLGSAISTAGMYRGRMIRLSQEGDAAGAKEARKKAVEWAYFYASLATSGGEGAALSRERDQFLESLGPEG